MEKEKIMDISWETIFKIAIAVVLFYFLFLIKDIIIAIVFAIVIAVLFNPFVDFLQKKKVPRVLGASLIYLSFFGLFSVLIFLVGPMFINELNDFTKYLPKYFAKISPSLMQFGFQPIKNIQDLMANFGSNVESSSSTAMSALITFFGGIISTMFILSTAYFFSIEGRVMERALTLFLPKKYEATALNVWARCQKRVSSWFVARLLSCLFVSIMCYIAFLVLKVDYPFLLALFAGVFNFIPYIGPLITGAVLVVLLLPVSLSKTIFVILAFMLIQKIEEGIIAPVIMKKMIGLPSSLVIISLFIGGELWGIMGAILVIPLVGILYEFIGEFFLKKKERESIMLVNEK